MAKMFYTLDEAAARLNMSADEVRSMIDSGQLQEFRDGGEIKLKVDQVDLLAGGDEEDDGMIPLAESGELEPIGLSSSGTGSMFNENPADQTGISIFDPEGDDEADPAAQTQISGSMATPGFMSDAGASGSGSGLANIALEGDDTSLGADLLEDVYGSGGSDAPLDTSPEPGLSGGLGAGDLLGESALATEAPGGELFEPTGGQTELAPAQLGEPVVAVEFYDGTWSGLLGGVAVGMCLLLMAALIVVVMAVSGGLAAISVFSMTVIMAVVGGAAAVMLIGAVIGWVLLRGS